MKHGEGFVELPSNAPHPKCGNVFEGDSRRWSAVSQRVPRDAHQRFVKADVLGSRYRIPGEEVPYRSTVFAFSDVRARNTKSRRDPEGDQEK
jgi:hypothetical protein